MRHLAMAAIWFSTAFAAAWLFTERKAQEGAMVGFIGVIFVLIVFADRREAR